MTIYLKYNELEKRLHIGKKGKVARGKNQVNKSVGLKILLQLKSIS